MTEKVKAKKPAKSKAKKMTKADLQKIKGGRMNSGGERYSGC